MSEKEQAKLIIDRLPDFKVGKLLSFLQGMMFDDEMEDDAFCERMYQNYLDDPDPEKHEGIPLEELAVSLGIAL